METKEINITPPEGYEIDKENSTFNCIKFKPVTKRWRDNEDAEFYGYFITNYSGILPTFNANHVTNHNVFAEEKQAKSALAMAYISQIMANDERFGGVVTDEEWNDSNMVKYIIERRNSDINKTTSFSCYLLLAFHTEEQRDLFLEENEDLIKDYLMLD